MIVVTGGAGFIGSNMVWALNRLGYQDVLIVDHLKNGTKHLNLNGLGFTDYADKTDFRERRVWENLSKVELVIHMGACSSTTEPDGQYMMRNNYEYSRVLLDWAQRKKVPFIYASSASVYGDGVHGFREEPNCEDPLNVYAFSKFAFDQHVRRVLENKPRSPVIGLRFFNVYGPQEQHKGKMASVLFHFFRQYQEGQPISLFEGSENFRRDFVHVDDVVSIAMHFVKHPELSGIFNAGTGHAESFEALADAFLTVFPKAKKTHIPFPEELQRKYQKFTEADLGSLRGHGQYEGQFMGLGEGVRSYLDTLSVTQGYRR
jgi:ADP-L-glycero-D-manno-heptose 6-epimerase